MNIRSHYIIGLKKICIFFLATIPLFSSPTWANKSICGDIKIKFNNHADQLIHEIDDIELCARPAAEYRDKVFSNLKYRANRLKTCVQMVKQGKLGSIVLENLKNG